MLANSLLILFISASLLLPANKKMQLDNYAPHMKVFINVNA